MTSKLVLDNLAGRTTAGSITVVGEGNGTTTNLQQGLAKHWCSLNGTSTIAVRDSFNNASIADGGNGTYTIYNTNPFSVAGDQCVASAIVANQMNVDSTPTATAVTVVSKNTSNTNTDSAHVSVSCLGDLA